MARFLLMLKAEQLSLFGKKREPVKEPGSKGGKGYYDSKGVWQYGDRPAFDAAVREVQAQGDGLIGRERAEAIVRARDFKGGADPNVGAFREERTAREQADARAPWKAAQTERITAEDILHADWQKIAEDVRLGRRGLTSAAALAMVESAYAAGAIPSAWRESLVKHLTPPARLTYEQFAAQYRAAFKEMSKYKPTEVGSQVFVEKMAKLADDYPEFEARFDQEEEAAHAKPAAPSYPERPVYAIDYTGPRWTYALRNRPMGPGAQPKGFIIGSDGPTIPGTHARFGTIQYPRELTAEEIASYELHPMKEPPPPALADAALASYRVYGDRFLSSDYNRASKVQRDAVDGWLVATKHPLASEPGTAEQRFTALVREILAKEPHAPAVSIPASALRVGDEVHSFRPDGSPRQQRLARVDHSDTGLTVWTEDGDSWGLGPTTMVDVTATDGDHHLAQQAAAQENEAKEANYRATQRAKGIERATLYVRNITNPDLRVWAYQVLGVVSGRHDAQEPTTKPGSAQSRRTIRSTLEGFVGGQLLKAAFTPPASLERGKIQLGATKKKKPVWASGAESADYDDDDHQDAARHHAAAAAYHRAHHEHHDEASSGDTDWKRAESHTKDKDRHGKLADHHFDLTRHHLTAAGAAEEADFDGKGVQRRRPVGEKTRKASIEHLRSRTHTHHPGGVDDADRAAYARFGKDGDDDE